MKKSRKRRIKQISTFGMEREFKFFTQASNLSDHDLRMNTNSSNFMEKFAKADLDSWKPHASVESIRFRPSEWKGNSNSSRKRRIYQITTFGWTKKKFLKFYPKADLELLKKSRKRRIYQITTFGMKKYFNFFTQASNLSDHDLRMNKEKLSQILSLENLHTDSLIIYLDKFSPTYRKGMIIVPIP